MSPLEIVIVPSVSDPPCTAPENVAATPPVIVPASYVAAPSLKAPAVTVPVIVAVAPPTSPVTVKSLPIVTSFGKPIVKVSVAETATSTSFAVPAIVNVSPMVIAWLVLPSVIVNAVVAAIVESTYVLLAASPPFVGADTCAITELLTSTLPSPFGFSEMSPFAFDELIALPSMSMLSTDSLPVTPNVSVESLNVNTALSLNAPPVPAYRILPAVSVESVIPAADNVDAPVIAPEAPSVVNAPVDAEFAPIAAPSIAPPFTSIAENVDVPVDVMLPVTSPVTSPVTEPVYSASVPSVPESRITVPLVALTSPIKLPVTLFRDNPPNAMFARVNVAPSADVAAIQRSFASSHTKNASSPAEPRSALIPRCVSEPLVLLRPTSMIASSTVSVVTSA